MYSYFRTWRKDGTWIVIHDQLRAWVRVVEKRALSPSVAIVDSQSVKSAAMIHEAVGYDVGKQYYWAQKVYDGGYLGVSLAGIGNGRSALGSGKGVNKSSNESNVWVKQCTVSTLFGLMVALMVRRS